MSISVDSERHLTGEDPGAGTFSCVACATQVFVDEQDRIPLCPRCGGRGFERGSIFEPEAEPCGEGTAEFAAQDAGVDGSAWLAEMRASLAPGARALACCDDDQELLFELAPGWTRVGRSANAAVRLDDPTVSRRHALIISEPGRPLRVLDDRSLNGVVVNGKQAEWATLGDGDELIVGRYRLHCIET